ncbi:MAG TPA: hypothetical protein DIW47_10135 [Bacteroidetes bacterium]|nr:hypothetical protein [Bacteroidota bacterium]
MNITELHQNDKEVSAVNLFKGELGTSTAIQLKRHGTLKEHATKTPALLLCITGLVSYEDETEKEVVLEPGDFIHIVPAVKHWLYASVPSQLVLLK